MSHFCFKGKLALENPRLPLNFAISFAHLPRYPDTLMRFSLAPFSLIATLSLATLGTTFSQDADAEQSRKLLEQHKAALVVITAKGKLEATTSGDPLPARDQQRRTLGVTIGDDGLIVVSNSAIDASLGLSGQQAKMDDKVVTIKEAKTVFSDVEISYGDSTLLHGKVVRQDAEADIAFIMPDAAEAKALNKTFEKVDFSQFAATAQEADKVVGLSRASAVYGYMPTVVVGRVTGVYKGDRTFFVTNVGTAQGIPVFTLEGKPIGLTVVRIIDGNPSGVLGTLSAGSIQVMANLAREAAK